jgi:hypothetical protein
MNAGSEKLDSDAVLAKKNGEVVVEPTTRCRNGQRLRNLGREKLDSDGADQKAGAQWCLARRGIHLIDGVDKKWWRVPGNLVSGTEEKRG